MSNNTYITDGFLIVFLFIIVSIAVLLIVLAKCRERDDETMPVFIVYAQYGDHMSEGGDTSGSDYIVHRDVRSDSPEPPCLSRSSPIPVPQTVRKGGNNV